MAGWSWGRLAGAALALAAELRPEVEPPWRWGHAGRRFERRQLRSRFARLGRCAFAQPYPQVEPGRLPGDGIGIRVPRALRVGRQQVRDGVVEQKAAHG